MTHRFFVPASQIDGSGATILGSDAEQIRLVLRLKPPEIVELLDGSGRIYKSKITGISKGKISCEILESRTAKSEPRVNVTLIQGIPRETRMDLIIQKGTELGVKKIIPAVTERTIIKIDEKKKSSRMSRWQRIAKEAAEQSGRGEVPGIEDIASFDDAIKDSSGCDLKLIPWEMEQAQSIKDILVKHKSSQTIAIAIGPEGGFSNEEVGKAKAAGFIPVSLGRRILRTETAGIAALSMINYEREMT